MPTVSLLVFVFGIWRKLVEISHQILYWPVNWPWLLSHEAVLLFVLKATSVQRLLLLIVPVASEFRMFPCLQWSVWVVPSTEASCQHKLSHPEIPQSFICWPHPFLFCSCCYMCIFPAIPRETLKGKRKTNTLVQPCKMYVGPFFPSKQNFIGETVFTPLLSHLQNRVMVILISVGVNIKLYNVII